jgi:hypothetical protein
MSAWHSPRDVSVGVGVEKREEETKAKPKAEKSRETWSEENGRLE